MQVNWVVGENIQKFSFNFKMEGSKDKVSSFICQVIDLVGKEHFWKAYEYTKDYYSIVLFYPSDKEYKEASKKLDEFARTKLDAGTYMIIASCL